MLSLSVVLISAALVAYTCGVWAERRAGTLTRTHAGLFGAGLVFDAAGTLVMTRIAAAGAVSDSVLTAVMTLTGALALGLMGIHLAWALAVLARDRFRERAVFHRFSLAVWGLWLVPYVTGMLGAAL